MTAKFVCACLLSALSIVEMKTLRVEGRVGKDVAFTCSNWRAWSNVRENVKYLCHSPCTEDKHIIIRAAFRKTTSKNRIEIINAAEGLYVIFKNLKMSDSKKYYCGVERFGPDTFIEANLKVIDAELPVPKTSAKPVTVGSTVSSAVSSSNLDITTDILVSYSTIYMTPTASAVVPEKATYFLIGFAATVTTLIVLLVLMKTVKRQQKIVTSADSPPEEAQESAGPDGVYEKLHPSTIDGDQVYSTLTHTMRNAVLEGTQVVTPF